MAHSNDWTPHAEENFRRFLSEARQSVRELAAVKPPQLLYMLGVTGRRVVITRYCQCGCGTVSVQINSKHNRLLRHEEIDLEGIDPASLTECDRPAASDTGFIEFPVKAKAAPTPPQGAQADMEALLKSIGFDVLGVIPMGGEPPPVVEQTKNKPKDKGVN